MKNLIDDSVIILNGRKHLTTTKSSTTRIVERFESGGLSLPLFQEHARRKTIVHDKTTKSTTKTKEKLKHRLSYQKKKEVKIHEDTVSNALKILQDYRDLSPQTPDYGRSEGNGTSICCVCMKRIQNKIRCKKCASTFHAKCRRGQTECPCCAAGNTPTNIVYAKIDDKQKWWPAIVISEKQVPKKFLPENPSTTVGDIYVLFIGKYIYKRIHASKLLSFQIDDAYREKFVKMDANLITAIEIATAVNTALASDN